MGRKVNAVVNGFRKRASAFDYFGESFRINVYGSKHEVQTFFGAIVTLLMYLSIVTYGALKYMIMKEYADTRVQISHISHYYNHS